MGLKFENLEVARAFMIEEIDMDARNEQIYLSTYLTQSGQGQWSDMLRAAAQNGNDDSLATEITRAGVLNRRIQKRTPKGRIIWADVPYNANQVLGEGEFNRYFCRGLSRHAMETKIPRLEVYRAKQVAQPRIESEQKIG